MSTEQKFCPNCGAILEGKSICSQCGFDMESQADANTKINTADAPGMISYENTNKNVWNTIEKYVVFTGKWSWLVLIGNILVYLIAGIIALIGGIALNRNIGGNIGNAAIGSGIWMMIGAILSGLLIFFFVLPFSKKIAARDYNFLVNDVVVLGKLRLPKMLLLGIILEVFTQGWGGLFVLVPALCICFLGPAYMRWRV
ncbi:MAG: hypothetical protein DRO88_09235 [Promethearchaeia archaeon]|nr:MAG: hypothetical protein DRO88_09235 [Candidatus Lokiarchaeia archaeon]